MSPKMRDLHQKSLSINIKKKREHEIGDDKKRMLRRNVPFVTKTST